ncbi:Ig-like domain-containing protein [Kitasatospora sp. NPDC101176]|uniref:Ig-like domain-containing protein n=1 Tax=Kitasatospora sp. NPDC101176 TaxID=3364099 RepID=UPI0037F795DE
MSLSLYVDTERRPLHRRTLLTEFPELVPVVDGNGICTPRLARQAALLGLGTLAVGTAQEAAEVLADGFTGEVLVLAPYRIGEDGPDLPGERVIRTAGSPEALRALAGRRVVVECTTGMHRHGITRRDLLSLAPTLAGVVFEGFTLNLPPDVGDPVSEVSGWLSAIAGAGLPPCTVHLGRLDAADLAALAARFPTIAFRSRTGTGPRLGGAGALRTRAGVPQAPRIAGGELPSDVPALHPTRTTGLPAAPPRPARDHRATTGRRRRGTGAGWKRKGAGLALLTAVVLAGASGCDGTASAGRASTAATPQPGTSAGADGGAGTSGSPSPSQPSAPPLQIDSITPADGSTVGVAMPVSIVFSHPVAASARAAVEQQLKVTTAPAVTGAWHWFGDRRVDWRPQDFWASGTKVSVVAAMTGVSDGNGRVGTQDYTHTFTIGADVEAKVSVPGHQMQVFRNGSLVRTLPIDAGSASFPSWDGTMAVIDKQKEVRMTSCSAGITCDKNSPDFYDLTLPWDVHLTYSGTYVHYSTGDPAPGHGEGSHGCVHLSMADAQWFYDYVEQGDPVTVTGSQRGDTGGDNGYAAFTLSWSQWLAGSALPH